MIRLGTKKIIPFYEDYKPVEVRKNNIRIAGWLTETKSGEAVDFENTYNDTADVVVKGKTLQKSEWVRKEGQTSQAQTVQGKNLFDYTKSPDIVGVFGSGGETITYQGSSSGLITYIPCLPNTTYTVSQIKNTRFGIADCNTIPAAGVAVRNRQVTTYEGTVFEGRWSNTITTSSDAKYLAIRYTHPGFDSERAGLTPEQIKATIQVEIGGAATSFEPFVPNSPSPEYPSPIVSNLPAGTYKTQDWRGDWWEFTLTEDLHGIDDVRDSVEFDKYSHKGFLRKKTSKVVFDGSETLGNFAYHEDTGLYRVGLLKPADAGTGTSTWGKKILCSHEFHKDNSLGTKPNIYQGTSYFTWTYDANAINATSIEDFNLWLAAQHATGTPVTVVYQLATPTRTPLTFTKNNASTAPECPMEFLTDTPSLEYPAELFDASGTVKARGKNLFDKSTAEFYQIAYTGSPGTTGRPYTWDFESGTLVNNPLGGSLPAFRATGVKFSCAPGKEYTVSWKTLIEPSAQRNSINWYNQNDEFIGASASQSPNRITGVAPDNAAYGVGGMMSNADNETFSMTNIQIEIGSEATAYEPYRPEVSAPIPPLRSNADGTVCDEFEVKTGKLTRKIGRIESYNGEDVGDDWISSTGALDTGATVEYVLAEPIITHLDPATVPTYPWYTRIEHDGEVKGMIEATCKVME